MAGCIYGCCVINQQSVGASNDRWRGQALLNLVRTRRYIQTMDLGKTKKGFPKMAKWSVWSCDKMAAMTRTSY